MLFFVFRGGVSLAAQSSPPDIKEVSAYFFSELSGRERGVTFKYADSFFENPSTSLSSNIAKASMGVTSSSYSREKVQKILKQMGFEVIMAFNYDRVYTKDSNDFAGYIAAKKEIKVSGREYMLYFINIRGTYEEEWYSNLNVGNGACHEGFNKAASEAFKNLAPLITSPAASSKIWVTGHSRGGAVANILGRAITESLLAYEENIYVYTFACPGVTKEPKSLPNIFNFYNPGDIVVKIPLGEWGFARNGRDIAFSREETVLKRLDSIYKSGAGGPYGGLYSTLDFESLVIGWAPTLKDYYAKKLAGVSPYECMRLLIPYLITGSPPKLFSVIAAIVADSKARGVVYYLYENDKAITYGHCQETYIFWLEAMYPVDIITGVSLTPQKGVYTGLSQPALLIGGVYPSDKISYSFDGDVFFPDMPHITDAGALSFFVRIKRGGYEDWTSEKLTASLDRAVFDLSGVTCEKTSFVYDGGEKLPSLLSNLPKGLTPLYSGKLKAISAGEYQINVKWKYDEKNYKPPEDFVIKWVINKAEYDLTRAGWDYERSFDYDGVEKRVRLVGLPRGVTAVYHGTYSAVLPGIYIARAELLYDAANFKKPSVPPLTWEISEGGEGLPAWVALIIITAAGGVTATLYAAAYRKVKSR